MPHDLPQRANFHEVKPMYFYIVLLKVLCFSLEVADARNASCITLFSNEMINEPVDSFVSCSYSGNPLSNFATFCLPICGQMEVTEFIEWYSQIDNYIRDASSGLSNLSLFYGTVDWLNLHRSRYFTNSYSPSMFMQYFLSPMLSKVLAGAFSQFARHAEWQRVAVIVDTSNSFLLSIAEELHRNFASTSNDLHVQNLDSELAIEKHLKIIKSLKFKAIILILPENLQTIVLCKRFSLGMTWPGYTWLAANFHVKNSSMRKCKDKVILFQNAVKQHHLPTPVWKKNVKFVDITRPHRNVSIVCKLSSSPEVDIFYYNENEQIQISRYSQENGLAPVLLDHIPSDVHLETSAFWYITISILSTILFSVVTGIFILYVYFRKEPSVKATGVSLNILTFLGCYLLLVYIPMVNLILIPNYSTWDVKARNGLCTLQLWMNGASLPSALIQAVLLVKLVRVYRLFHQHSMINKWQCHDGILAIYVIVLSTPIILSCFVQSASQKHFSIKISHITGGVFIAYYACRSDVDLIYFVFQIAYLYSIAVGSVVMALKTRKIQHKDFKDTKKVIALVVLSIFTSCLALVYFIIFEGIKTHPIYTLGLLSTSHTLYILETLFFLFVPKIFPILFKKLITNKKFSINSTSC